MPPSFSWDTASHRGSRPGLPDGGGGAMWTGAESCRFPRQGLGRVKELSQDLSGLAQIRRIACILVSSRSSKAGEL